MPDSSEVRKALHTLETTLARFRDYLSAASWAEIQRCIEVLKAALVKD